MSRLSILFSFLVISSFILMSCQSSDVTSPVEKLDKPGTIVWGTNPVAVNGTAGASTDIDLVAGQNMVVGHVTVVQSGDNLEITYYTDGDWSITETHLMVVATPQDFIINNGGNPKVGQFPYGTTGLDGNQAGPYEVPIPSGLTNNMVYIGAHAVVKGNCEGTSTSDFVCGTYPDQATLTPDWNPENQMYTVKFKYNFTPDSSYGFCLDNTRSISDLNPRTVHFLCSYDDMPSCTTFIEKPENLDLVNWIINNRQSGWDKKTVQAAIWELINPSGTLDNWYDSTGERYYDHNEILREQIVTMAEQNGEGFVPDCGGSVFVIVYGPGDICSPIRQVLGMIAPVDCVPTNCSSETAWAFNYPVDETSTGFPGANWFRYFGYEVASN